MCIRDSFIDRSIAAVYTTVAEAVVLVVLVILLFLRSARATLIPLVTIPVSLIGACTLLYAFGFSINTLTLLAMVLAIGLVVDDAIVVLENVERIMREEGLPPRDAAVKAMREVTGPIIAIVLTLTAVFVPIAFLGGLTGELYWLLGLAMSVCNIAGAQFGSHLAIRRGSALVRKVFIVVVFALITKTAWDAIRLHL